MGWSAGWEEVTVSRAGEVTVGRAGDVTICKLNIPPLHILRCASSRTSFKGGEVMVNRTERGDGQQDGER